MIRKASDIGIGILVVHPSGELIAEEERWKRMQCAKESLATLAEIAAHHGAVIAVKDLPRTCLVRDSFDVEQLISAHEKLRVCFDTNHLLSEDPADFVRKLGKKIITTHVSDYDFVNERHWLPGEGKIDWNSVMQAFSDIEYHGVWLYEIGFVCPKTILRDRDLTCEDFVKNAKELFERKPLTVMSSPKPNLG